MATKSWSSIRVQTSTLLRIKAFRMQLLQQYVEGRITLPDHQAEGVTVDYALNRLMDAVEDHRKRAAKSRRRKAAKPEATEGPES